MANVKDQIVSSQRLMSNFAFGADASNSVKFIAVVLGRTDDVASLRNNVCSEHGLKRIHMRRIIGKSGIVQTLSRLVTPVVHMYCFKVDRPRHTKILDSANKTRYMSATQRNQNIDYCIAMEMKDEISDSLNMFYQPLANLVVEADQDTRKIFNAMGLAVVSENYAYELADAVAWANNASVVLNTLRERDLTERIENRLRKKLKL